jgi:SPP1 gp7 family putative phage head morphogenesis protein
MRPFPFPIPEQITVAWFKAMVLQLNPDGDEDDDAEQQIRRQLEKRFERELAGAFDEQLDTLLPEGASDDVIRAAPHQVTMSSEPVREVLRRNLEQGSSLGVSVAFDTLEQIGMAFDYTLAHAKAARWASAYSYELVRDINATTSARLQVAVQDWFNERTTLPDLVKEIEPTFGRRRAKLIAQTETTRSAAMGAIEGYAESGVVQEMEWATVNDERRCQTCLGLDGKRAPLRGTFPGGYTAPAHPGCRCIIRPVIAEP